MADITTHVEDGVCEIRLTRVQKKNALTQQMYRTISDSIEQAQQDESVKVVLLCADGDFFCAGNDIGEFQSFSEHMHLSENVAFMQSLMNCKLPVVACVQGKAIGIGVTMLLHCDLVICSDESVFSMPFIELALVPEFASSFLLPKIAGHRLASKWLLLGDNLDANEAMQAGLVSHIVAGAGLSIQLKDVVNRLKSLPRQALLQTKALMKSEQDEIKLHMNDELDIFIARLVSPESREALNAYLEKREPDPSIYK